MITDQSGSAVQYYSFDACLLKHGFCEARTKTDVEIIPPEARRREGRRRNPADWTYNNVALINMNGRMYDPLLGRFLAPDNYVQAPDFSQSFNRYSYCLNNPLMYVDPTGYSWFSNFGDWLGKIGRAVVTTVVSITVTAVIVAIIVSSCGQLPIHKKI